MERVVVFGSTLSAEEIVTVSIHEGVALVSAVFLTLALSPLWGRQWRGYSLGVAASALALSVMWIWAKLSLVMPFVWPGEGTIILLAFPAVQEGIRAYCVYRLLPVESDSRYWIGFVVGYSLVEFSLKVATSFVEVHSAESVGASLISLLALLFFGLLMLGLKRLGANATLGFMFCFLLHATHNFFVSWSDRSLALEDIVLPAAAYAVGSSIAFVALLRPAGSPPAN